MKNKLTPEEYMRSFQNFVLHYALKKGLDRGLLYSSVGLVAEAGEVLEITQKMLRKKKDYDSKDLEKFKDELGDVLHYAARMCNDLNVNMTDILEQNVEKIAKRNS